MCINEYKTLSIVPLLLDHYSTNKLHCKYSFMTYSFLNTDIVSTHTALYWCTSRYSFSNRLWCNSHSRKVILTTLNAVLRSALQIAHFPEYCPTLHQSVQSNYCKLCGRDSKRCWKYSTWTWQHHTDAADLSRAALRSGICGGRRSVQWPLFPFWLSDLWQKNSSRSEQDDLQDSSYGYIWFADSGSDRRQSRRCFNIPWEWPGWTGSEMSASVGLFRQSYRVKAEMVCMCAEEG